MANRILLGQKGSDNGIWISKPGFDVLTCSDKDCLITPNDKVVQVIQSGTIMPPYDGNNIDVPIPDQGGYPLAMVYTDFGLSDPVSWPLNHTFSSYASMTIEGPSTGATYNISYIVYSIILRT